MRGRPRRAVWGIGFVSLFLAAAPATSAAPEELWTITPTTFTAYVDQAQSVTFTATNLSVAVPPSPAVIGCVRLNVPNSVSLDSAAMVSPTNGSWTATVVGGGVDVRATTMAARLGYGASVRFSIAITPRMAGAFLLGAWAYENMNCSAPQFGGSNNIAATVLPPVPATPTPQPIPSATPAPTPAATPNPLPTASPPPTPAPTVRPIGSATATPTAPPPGSSPDTGSAGPSPTARPEPGASEAPAASAPGLTLGPAGQQGSGDDLAIDIGIGTGLDGIEWTVPAVALGSPGIAVMVWVAIQAASGIVWLPWVRRLRRSRHRPA